MVAVWSASVGAHRSASIAAEAAVAAVLSQLARNASASPAHSGPSHTLTAPWGHTPEQPTDLTSTASCVRAAARRRPAPLRQHRLPVQIVSSAEPLRPDCKRHSGAGARNRVVGRCGRKGSSRAAREEPAGKAPRNAAMPSVVPAHVQLVAVRGEVAVACVDNCESKSWRTRRQSSTTLAVCARAEGSRGSNAILSMRLSSDADAVEPPL